MSKSLSELKLKDIFYGVIVPLIVGLIIIAFPISEGLLSQVNPALIGIFVFGIAEMIMTVGAPTILGLLWNKWAGGAAGFLLGSIFALLVRNLRSRYGRLDTRRKLTRLHRERNDDRLHRWSTKQPLTIILQAALFRIHRRPRRRIIPLHSLPVFTPAPDHRLLRLLHHSRVEDNNRHNNACASEVFLALPKAP